MKPAKPPETGVGKAVRAMLSEIRPLIEEARHRAVTAANLAMVTLYWNIGRVITTDLQQDTRRADTAKRLLERLAAGLPGIMGRDIRSAIYGTCGGFTPHSKFHSRWLEIAGPANPQPLAVESSPNSLPERVDRTPQTPSPELSERLSIDFARHFHLGWTHYRILWASRMPASAGSTSSALALNGGPSANCNARWPARCLNESRSPVTPAPW